MRLLTIVIAVLTVLYGGYWFVGSRALEHGITDWLASLPGQGIDTGATTVSIAGFPSRFDLTLTTPTFSDPVAGIGWTAPFVQILALSYQPYNIIAVWADSQTLILPGQTIGLTSSNMRASIRFQPTTALPLDHATLIIDSPALASDTGWTLGATQTRFATRKSDTANAHDIGAEITSLALPAALRVALDPDATLPDRIETLHLDATLTLDKPLDRFALAAAAPNLTAIALRDARLIWGPMLLSADGNLTVDQNGVLSGNILVKATDWERLVPMATALGLIAPKDVPLITRALTALAGLSPDPTRLEAPLSFSGGKISLGGIPVLDAPRLKSASAPYLQ